MKTRVLLRWLLIAQGAVAGAIGYAATRWLGIGPPVLALAFGVGVVLLVRLLITANNFVMTARFSSVTPAGFRLGAAGRLRLFGEEFMATMLQTSWFMARARSRQRIYDGKEQVPVLLLHGYGCNSGYWSHLIAMLDSAQISHATLDLEPMFGAIDDYVPLVQRAAESLCHASGSAQIIIVAHSMGGLVARAYLRKHGADRVARVITIGTPHHGTSLASFGVGANAAQMRRSSDPLHAESTWLRALAASEDAARRALIISIYTHHDNIVAPQTSSVLEGARNIAFGGVGHVALGRNRQVLARVMQEISAIEAHTIDNL